MSHCVVCCKPVRRPRYVVMSRAGDLYAPDAFPTEWLDDPDRNQGGFVVGPDCWRKHVIKEQPAAQTTAQS